MKILLSLIVCLCISSCHSAQTNPGRATIHDTAQPYSNNIMVIFQDSRDVYWFGSWEDGLYRYDGDTITHYTTIDGLPSNRIEEIREDKHGNLYFNTPDGLSHFNGVRFTDITIDTDNNGEWKLTSDDLWFKGHGEIADICRYDGEKLYGLKMPTTPIAEAFLEKYRPQYPRMSNPYAVYTIYRDRHGYVWFGTAAAGACRFDGKNIAWIDEPDVNELHLGPANGVRSILEDADGKFWFTTNFRYDVYGKSVTNNGTSMSYVREQSIGALDGIEDSGSDEYLYAIKDRNGSIWIVTYMDGAWKYDPAASTPGKPAITHYPIMDGKKAVTLFYIYEDRKGGIWIGTHDHGVYKFNGTAFEPFTP